MTNVRRMANAELLTTDEVAERMNVSKRTIARWVQIGKLTPAAKAPGIRGALLFWASDIESEAA